MNTILQAVPQHMAVGRQRRFQPTPERVATERRQLRPGDELDLGQVAYVHLVGQSNSVQLGELNIPNARFLWLAHDPSVLAWAGNGLAYGFANGDGYQAMVPQGSPGDQLTLAGVVATPEDRIDGIHHGAVERTTRVRNLDPYMVRVGMSDGSTQDYRNVPQVDINFL